MSITKISPDVVDFDAGITISTADNLDTLTLTSTDADSNSGPNLRLYRNSGTPADSDALGLIEFEGRNDNTQDVVYAGIDSRIVDASDGTEDGRIEIVAALAGTDSISRILMNSTETVFNDNSADLDFRVESNGNTSALFVDAGNDKVTTGVRLDFADLLIGTGAGKYIQVTGGSSNALAIGMDGGTAAPGTAATSVGFHHWNNSSWSNVMNVTRDGLAFGTDTATANSLDDYEEGTWTPQIIADTTNPTGGSNLSARGSYVKIGNRVFCTFYIGVSWTNSPSGGVYIQGIPYTITNNDNNDMHFPCVTYNFGIGNTEAPFLAIQKNTATVRLYMMSNTSWGAANFNAHVTSPLYISGQFSFFV